VIRLGHIDYANCFPVHARFLAESCPAGVEITTGVPADLNARLAAGSLDIAPCSSIEYARHHAEYRLLPGLSIASDGVVSSIRLESAVPLDALGGGTVCVPTASATSVVLLRILLEQRRGLAPEYRWYRQGEGVDPLAEGAVAALRIGDVALRRSAPTGRPVLDLGEDWTDWTGLPFVYAVWQARRDVDVSALHTLHDRLRDSLDWFRGHAASLAEAEAPRYGLTAAVLLRYWHSLRYDLDSRMQQGLLEYYRRAAELGEPAVPGIDWAIEPAPSTRP
jgi:chorismate dehydratase